MGEHLHGINLHLSAYPPVSDIESLIKTAIKSMNFFIRNSTIKFVFPCNKEKKNTKAKKNISELFSMVKGELKKISFGGILKKFKTKKNDKFSNVKLECMTYQKNNFDTDAALLLIDSCLESLKQNIES